MKRLWCLIVGHGWWLYTDMFQLHWRECRRCGREESYEPEH